VIRVATPTDASIEHVRARLSELAARANFGDRALARADPVALALAAPHDVYALGLADVAAGATLAAATLVGRRFLVMEGPTAIASVEIAASGAPARFEANEGPYVAATADALARAESDPLVAAGSFELRLLRIPALYAMALWLSDDDGRSDLLFPLAPAPAPLDARGSVGEHELLELLRPAARERLRVDDAP